MGHRAAGAAALGEPLELLSGPPLFDGCRLRYLDLGTNVGERLRSMYADLDRPPGKHEQLFEHENRTGVCTVGFEPNPHHARALAHVQEELRSRGHRVTVIPAAIGAANISRADFYSDLNPAKHEWGASLIHWSHRMNSRDSFQVPVIELDWLLRYHLGAASHGSLETLTLMKMDAEMAEYTALPAAIHSGSLCATVDELQLEQHDHLFRAAIAKNVSLLSVHPLTFVEVQQFKARLASALKRVIETRREGRCRTVIKPLSIHGTR